MVTLYINNIEFIINRNLSILEACNFLGLKVPRFCYYESLSIAGNCRMCLVELDEAPKLVASCAQPVIENIEIYLNTPRVKKARENVVELLLANHPMDCPICDQGGQCDLQDQSRLFGNLNTRFFYRKRGVENKYFDSFIKTIMTRCIQCTRCVRFTEEIMNVRLLGTLNRGTSLEIGNYVQRVGVSDLSGNLIDICPVGALTSKQYAFQGRPWELRSTNSVDLTDGTGSSVYINIRENKIQTITPKKNSEINGDWISNKARFSFDSNSQNRVHFPLTAQYVSNGSVNYNILSWSTLAATLQVNNKQSGVILVNNEIDFDTLMILKHLTYKTRIIIRKHNYVLPYSNLYIRGLTNKIIDLNKNFDACILIATNIQIESSILNVRLRLNHNRTYMTAYSCGLNTKMLTSCKVINLTITDITHLLQGKNIYALNFLKYNRLAYFIGESFLIRGISTLQLHYFLKKLHLNSMLFFINRFNNSESIRCLNIKAVTATDYTFGNYTVFIKLHDTIANFELIQKFSRTTRISIHTHGNLLNTKMHFVLPTQTYFEQPGLFLNLEQRAQIANASLTAPANTFTYTQILLLLWPITSTINPSTHLLFRLVLLTTSNFKEFQSQTALFIKNLPLFFKAAIVQVSQTPIRTLMKHSFTTTSDARYSVAMKLTQQNQVNFSSHS